MLNSEGRPFLVKHTTHIMNVLNKILIQFLKPKFVKRSSLVSHGLGKQRKYSVNRGLDSCRLYSKIACEIIMSSSCFGLLRRSLSILKGSPRSRSFQIIYCNKL